MYFLLQSSSSLVDIHTRADVDGDSVTSTLTLPRFVGVTTADWLTSKEGKKKQAVIENERSEFSTAVELLNYMKPNKKPSYDYLQKKTTQGNNLQV